MTLYKNTLSVGMVFSWFPALARHIEEVQPEGQRESLGRQASQAVLA